MPSSNTKKLPAVMITLLLVFVIAWTGTYALNEVAETGSTGETVNQAALLESTQTIELGHKIGKNETVKNSLGNAVRLTGSDNSYFEASKPITIASDKNWTVSTWASINSTASSDTMTLLSVDGRLIITYNGTASDWQIWYYDEATRNSYWLNASTTADEQLTNLQVRRSDGNLELYENATRVAKISLQSQYNAPAPNNTANWEGRVDEVRTFDTALNASMRNGTYNSPVAPQAAGDRTARIMFDQPGKQKQLLFFASGYVRIYNGSIVNGLAGETLEGESVYNDITDTTDYKWDIVGPKISPVEGGQLDGAPVAYVEYETTTQTATLVDDWTNAIQILGVAVIVLPLGLILTYLYALRSGR